MSLHDHLRAGFSLPDFTVRAYLEDLTDEELLVRPHPEINHIAYQLGHLISGENFHGNRVRAESMPPLPDGFADAHDKDNAKNDDPSAFLSKKEYFELMTQQRAAMLALLDSLSEEELFGPTPEGMDYFGPTLSCVFSGEASHWMMHTGQWAVIRRTLGKPPLF